MIGEKIQVIKVNDLYVNYDNTIALAGVDLDVHENEFLGIIGPNGGGKTTLVKSILGLLKPVSGKVEVVGQQVLGYVPQFTSFDRQFPITVQEVILSGHLPKRIKWFKRFDDHDTKHAATVMGRLGIENLADRQIGALSGGQMQRVLIARALMHHPTILVLDEPTAGVDETSKNDIYKMLKELNQEMTILMITHNTSEVMSYLDRVVYINKKAHVHENISGDKLEGESCPIDWFIQGEEIQKDLLKEGDADAGSHLYV